ncbi:hypothetical protein EBZ38_17105 [bacterium]|nr:hypothetical protein [bacterium]NDC96426.1 hypothetical protein [bacterium]NDD85979.1 hypothetical protein [bacterium]NDG20173.1 hypothetical protein [Betaproteobacteria bacterium]
MTTNKTKQADCVKRAELTKARIASEKATENAQASLRQCIERTCGGNREEALAIAVKEAQVALDAMIAAENEFKKLPKARRTFAEGQIKLATDAANWAAELGGEYSGQTGTAVEWRSFAGAKTETSLGDKYHRFCTYRKTNAVHTVSIDARRIHLLTREIVQASRNLGKVVIALDEDGRCSWVRRSNKQLVAENGWLAAKGDQIALSSTSLAGARQQLARKAVAA